ncbi:NudC domain-containing protein 3 [Papilio xuthus]|uniref:NudC domain-containing protein 3 n=1 Tax=Papilio xuthus TaxID=66420 RepID=A0A194QCG5_PAPXU|nr:NudC domain-containing protein 3 [Papilio xuthus]
MSDSNNIEKYDDVLTSILVNEKSILGFLSSIFNFLARRTDFYYVPENKYENMGFPPGVAEELVIKVLRSCDPKNYKSSNKLTSEINNEIMCNTVAEEVEVIAEDDSTPENDENTQDAAHSSGDCSQERTTNENKEQLEDKSNFPEDYKPPVIPVQKNSESYNGAVREMYTWAQTIMELDVTIKLPPNTKSKDLKVVINNGDICIQCRNGEVIIKDNLPYKIKANDSVWSISEGKLLIHLEKVQERWWDRFLSGEEPIDLNKIDASRPLDELPEDHIAKVRELQWNQEQKLKGLPTSDEIRNMEILKKAWNAEGSPFKGQEFDPSVLQIQ